MSEDDEIGNLTETMTKNQVTLEDVTKAHHLLKDVVVQTPLVRDRLLSERYDCDVYLKREDLQVVRSFKIRGAYHYLLHLSGKQAERGVVAASAGNHAQGVAFACKKLGIPGKIFMPVTTPRQKMARVKFFGDEKLEVVLTGDTFDDAYRKARAAAEEEKRAFVHPFDDPLVIAGQGTVALEILNQSETPIDFLFTGVGGGGLAAGLATYTKSVAPRTKVIGVEPEGAPGMKTSIEKGKVVTLDDIDPFVDGAAVRRVGSTTMEICARLLDDILVVSEGDICTTILNLYNENAIVAEPAGALAVAALESYREKIRGKTVVCVVSGGNNDIDRMQEIKERSLIARGLQHYFIIHFPQRPGALREFINQVLGEYDDITRFEYMKKNNREKGPTLVGIEFACRTDYERLLVRMKEHGISFMELNKNPGLFQLLV